MKKLKYNVLDGEKKFLQSVGRKGLYFFFVYLCFKITNTFIISEPTPWEIAVFFFEVGGSFIAVLYAVDKPGVGKLIKNIRLALQDGKITRDEAMAILRETFLLVVGFWADQGVLNHMEKDTEEMKKTINAI